MNTFGRLGVLGVVLVAIAAAAVLLLSRDAGVDVKRIPVTRPEMRALMQGLEADLGGPAGLGEAVPRTVEIAHLRGNWVNIVAVRIDFGDAASPGRAGDPAGSSGSGPGVVIDAASLVGPGMVQLNLSAQDEWIVEDDRAFPDWLRTFWHDDPAAPAWGSTLPSREGYQCFVRPGMNDVILFAEPAYPHPVPSVLKPFLRQAEYATVPDWTPVGSETRAWARVRLTLDPTPETDE